MHFAVAVLKNLQDKQKDVLKILTPNFIGILVGHSKKFQKNSELLDQLLDQAILGLKKDETKLRVLKVLTKLPGFIFRIIHFQNLVGNVEDFK